MPAVGESYKTSNSHQQKPSPNQHQQNQQSLQYYQSPNVQKSVSPPEGTHSFSPVGGHHFTHKAVSNQFSTIPGVGSGGVGGNYKHRIFPKEINHPIFKTNQTATASPLISALSNPTDLFARSFLSASPSTSSTGGSPSSSWPVSYTNNGSLPRGIGGSVPRNGAYPSFEEHLSNHGAFATHQRHTSSSGDMGKLKPGDASYACSFDTLDGDSENVLCFGWEGGLDVWRIGKGSLDLLGRLEGLAGGVRSAKILPTPQRDDPLASIRPLIVLTIQTSIQAAFQDDPPSPAPPSPPSRPRSAASSISSQSNHISHGARYSRDIEWQTSVEIYSLSTQERITVLFTSPLEPSPVTSMAEVSPPPVWGALRVEVSDKFITVGVGLSGEIYLFALISVVAAVQPQPITTSVAHELKKGRKGKVGNSQQKAAISSPPVNISSTEVRGEWVCQGKVWTTVQIPTGGSFSVESGNNGYPTGGGTSSLGFFQNGVPVFSLQGRWLSYSPPPASSSISAGGIVKVSHSLAASSVMSQSPPSQPSITAMVDITDGEEKLINRMAREATQEVIRGAKWVGEHGMKAWHNYWGAAGSQSGSGSQSLQTAPNSLPSSHNGGSSGFTGIGGGVGSVMGVSALGQQLQRERQMQQMATYTNGMTSPYFSSNGATYTSSITSTTPLSNSTSANSAQHHAGGYVKSAMHGGSDPIYVSILDLGKFPSSVDETQMLPTPGFPQCTPFATFQPPLGVSYLSFAPGGLTLLTVSGKGDVYSVWDLMRLIHKPTNPTQGHSGSSSVKTSLTAGSPLNVLGSRNVRLITRFTRMTVARIVDVTWSFPRGEKLAVITDRGTAHFYDLPYSAYQWPPYRKPPPSSASASGSPVQQAAGVVQAVQGAVSLIGSSTQPLLTAARRHRPSSSIHTIKLPSPTGGIFVNPRARQAAPETTRSSEGGKETYLPNGVNKVSLPGNPQTIAPGFVKFLVGKEKGRVALTGGGLLDLYQMTDGSLGGSKKRRSMTSGGILLESCIAYDLPALPGNMPVIKDHNDENQLIEIDKVVSGYWSGKSHHTIGLSDVQYRRKDEQQPFLQHPLSFAEIETTPAYPAFHTDRRVTLMIFSDGMSTTTVQQFQPPPPVQFDSIREDTQTDKNAKWVYGLPIKAEKLNLGGAKGDVEFLDNDDNALEDAMESRLKLSNHTSKDGEDIEKVIMKAKRKKRGKNTGIEGEEGFFEEDCVLDFTSGA